MRRHLCGVAPEILETLVNCKIIQPTVTDKVGRSNSVGRVKKVFTQLVDLLIFDKGAKAQMGERMIFFLHRKFGYPHQKND